MKKQLLLSGIILLFILQIHAQWTNNSKVNTMITDYTNTVVDNPKILLDESNNSAFIPYQYRITGDYQWNFGLTRINMDGEHLWDSPVVIDNNYSDSWTTHYGFDIDDEGCAVLINRDKRDNFSNAFAWRISADGEKLWGDDGLQLSYNDKMGLDVSCMSVTQINDGDYIFGWSIDSLYVDSTGEDRYKKKVYLQKVGKDMSLRWDEPVILTNDTTGYLLQDYDITPKYDGGFYVMFTGFIRVNNTGMGILEYSNIYVQNFDADGVALWDDPLQLDENNLLSANKYLQAELNINADDEIIIVWASAKGMYRQNKIQKIDNEGSIYFGENGKYIVINDHMQSSDALTYDEESDNSFIYWTQMIQDGFNVYYELVAQKISSDGDLLWGDGAKILMDSDTSMHITGASILADGSSIVSFYNELDHNINPDTVITASEIYATRLDTDGNFVWYNDFVALSDTLVKKANFEMSSFSNGECIMVWNDGRKDDLHGGSYPIFYSDVMAQNILENGNLGPVSVFENASFSYELLKISPNPVKSGTPINLTFVDDDHIHITIYDMQGKVVKTYSKGDGIGKSMSIPTSYLPSGCYTIVAISGKNNSAAKIIIN